MRGEISLRRFTVYASEIEHRGYFASPFSETEWKVIYPLQNSFEYVTVTPGEDAEMQVRNWIDEHIAETTDQQQTETASMSAYYANLLAELTEQFATYANLHMTSYESVTGRFLGKDLRIRATDETVRKWINSFNNGSEICQKELIGLTLAGSEPSGEYDKNIYHLGLQSIEPKESKQVKGSKKMNRKFTKFPNKAVTAAAVSPEEDEAAYNELVNTMRSNPAYKELESICNSYGYSLSSAYVTSKGLIDMSIQPADRDHFEVFLYSKSSIARRARIGDLQIKVQTVSVGSLNVEELQHHVAMYQDALAMATAIEQWDGWSNLMVFDPEY